MVVPYNVGALVDLFPLVYLLLCYPMSCSAILCHAMLYHVMFYLGVMQDLVIPCHAMGMLCCFVMPYSCPLMLC